MSDLGIFLNILFLIIGFFMLVKGADWFVEGASNLAGKFGVPQIVIGLTIVAIGTSLPEAAVSINAAAKGVGSIAIGNILGSNIANVLLILGISALICPLAIKKNTLWIEIPFVILITIMFLVMGEIGGVISRIDAGIMLAVLALFFAYLIVITVKQQKEDKLLKANLNSDNIKANPEIVPKKECNNAEVVCVKSENTGVDNSLTASGNCVEQSNETEQPKKLSKYKLVKQKFDQLKEKNVWIMLLLIAVGGVCVVYGSTFVVDTAKALAKNWGMSENFIGLTIVAIGTSLPELVTSVTAAMKKKADIAIGNVIGSNIFNILFVLGAASMVKPMEYSASFLVDSIIALAAVVALFLFILFTKDKKLKRWGGGILTAGYLSYFIYLIVVSF